MLHSYADNRGVFFSISDCTLRLRCVEPNWKISNPAHNRSSTRKTVRVLMRNYSPPIVCHANGRGVPYHVITDDAQCAFQMPPTSDNSHVDNSANMRTTRRHSPGALTESLIAAPITFRSACVVLNWVVLFAEYI